GRPCHYFMPNAARCSAKLAGTSSGLHLGEHGQVLQLANHAFGCLREEDSKETLDDFGFLCHVDLYPPDVGRSTKAEQGSLLLEINNPDEVNITGLVFGGRNPQVQPLGSILDRDGGLAAPI